MRGFMPIEAVAEAEAENKGRNEGKARVRKIRIHSITYNIINK